jgi:RNA polymerase sigma-70 factor, ECF subfamily
MEAEPLQHLSDDALAECFRTTGDSVLFGEIFRRYRQVVYRFCLAMMRDPETAADQTQETFIRAMLGIHGYTGGHMRAWLMTIARHQCINLIRSRNHGWRSLEGPAALEKIEVPGEDVVGRITLRALLAPLSEEQRLCLKLFYFNGMSYAEISDLARIEEGAVKSHIQNGMRRMRKARADCGTK